MKMPKWQCDYIAAILEEIALEGLEGITIEALWTRLCVRPFFEPRPENYDIQSFLWKAITRLLKIEFYLLPEPRKPLVIFNRSEHIDESGNFMEPDDISHYCIYDHSPINKNGEMGSCKFYDERINISSDARVKELLEVLECWGNSLVIVARQEVRKLVLTNPEFNPLAELSLMQYCVLERIGRSRYHGELTQGKLGLQQICDDAKMLFYFRKNLLKSKLITKQLFYLKVGKGSAVGSLLQLPRYASIVKHKHATDGEKLIDYIKMQPGQYILYKNIHDIIGPNADVKKVLKRYKRLKSEMVPYRKIYPDAAVNEWKMKSGVGEKIVRIVKLSQLKESDAEEEEFFDEEEEQAGFVDCSERQLDRILLRQCYSFIEKAGPRGLSQSSISQLAGLPSLQARSVCRYLMKNKICGVAFVDAGRQRICQFYSKKFDSSKETLLNEMKEEKSKLIQIVSNKQNESKSNNSENIEVSPELPSKKLKIDENLENSPKKKPQIRPTQEEMDVIETQIISKEPVSCDKSFPNLTGENDTLQANLTITILRRANLILQAINTHKVIHDPQKILRMINEEEESEGARHVIDRRTVTRLLDKLESDGHLKTIKVNIKGHGRERNLTFICHPSIDKDHSEIQSAIEQAKMKLPIITKDSVKKRARLKRAGQLGTDQDPFREPLFNYDQRAGKRYGFKPKFVRMQVLHIYMYYLIYGYNGDVNLNQDESKHQIIKNLKLDDSIINEMTTVYSTNVDWKMFIPPLPIHEDYGEGWSLMSDLLLRLPLSLFVSIINVPYDIPGLLEEYINHPIRKYFLVKHLPSDISNHLTFNRKYIFSVSETISRLTYIGLVQMGPQKLKEKDQVFIYLNRHALLFDTTTSEPGYNHVSTNIDYEQLNYHFVNQQSLEQYWHDLWNCAMNTNLGCRHHMTGHSVVIESINTKKALMACTQPKTFEDAKTADVAYLPGDHLGAGGIDSDLFVHLKRSWYWPTEEKNDENDPEKVALQSHIKDMSKVVGKKRTSSQLNLDPSDEGTRVKKSKETNTDNQITKSKKGGSTLLKPKKSHNKTRAKHKKITRIVKPKTTRFGRKPYYDQIDREALKRMVKLRVDWSSSEDNILLICKVASLYMINNKRRQIARNFCAVREILHSTYPNLSKNKTSRACQRRINYMMKNPSTAHSVYMCLEEIKQDPEINDKFSQAVAKLDAVLKAQGEGPKGYQEEYDKIFNNLVSTLLSKLKTITSTENATLDNVSIPDSLNEFREKYAVIFPKNVALPNGTFNEIQNTVDILCSVVNTILHSSLCCATDKTSYSYQLLHIYQQYPDKLLRSVMAKCRSMSIISCKKNIRRWKVSTSACLPLSSSPYQLSITYVNILQTRYQYVIFSECYRAIIHILEEYDKQKSSNISSSNNSLVEYSRNNSQIQDSNVSDWEGDMVLHINNGGECANMVELYSAGCAKLEIEFPEQLITLDPRLTKPEEPYKLIVKRFRELICMIKGKSSKNDKKSILSEEEEYEDDEDEMNVNKTRAISEQEDNNALEDDFTLSNKSGITNPATRLALYLMRDEPLEYLDQSLQHAHDLFLLKPCKIKLKINRKTIEEVLLREDISNEIISDMRRLSNFPESHNETHTIFELLRSECNENILLRLLNYLEEKKELGATYNDIQDNVGSSKDIEKILHILVQRQYILKTGCVNVRFIHNKFTKPWLIRSYYLPRYKREELGNTNTNTSCILSLTNNEDKLITNKDVNNLDERLSSQDNVNNVIASEWNNLDGDRTLIQEFNQENVNDSNRIIMRTKKKRGNNISKETINKFGNINQSSIQHIHISIRPWIRIDGTLNRRVLDRLLGSVLGHCLSVPGITLKQIQYRFTPALQPVHTLDLIEILQRIGCLRMMVLKKSSKPSLFSKRSDLTLEPASGFDSIDNILIEPEILAISKLGQFIGNTTYAKDYLDALTDSKMLSYS